tara:strand:+ start:488 stop:679 length:192 start_codon:yes stop_codon:yes gene_type:complete
MDLVTVAVALSVLYLSVAAVMWVSSKRELKKLEEEKNLELLELQRKLKRLADKAKKRRQRRSR